MAKKTKKPLSPEQAEIKAMKKEKSSKGWTKFFAILLALVLTVGVVFVAHTTTKSAIEKAGGNAAANSGTAEPPKDESKIDGGATDELVVKGEDGEEVVVTKADVVKLFNDTTAQAAKGSYKILRTGKFTKDIDVGNATSALDKIIKGVDKNASLNSVVGGFLGLSKPVEATVTNGKGEGFDGKYMIKPMTLTEADVMVFKVEGDKYTIQINQCVTPQEGSALANATNDYITFAEVNKSIAGAVGNAVKVEEANSQAVYGAIVFTATIKEGKLVELEYSYTFSATLSIKLIGMGATGTGEAEINGKYSDIQY